MIEDIALTVDSNDGAHYARVMVWPEDKDLTIVCVRKEASFRSCPKSGKPFKEMLAKLRRLFPTYNFIFRGRAI